MSFYYSHKQARRNDAKTSLQSIHLLWVTWVSVAKHNPSLLLFSIVAEVRPCHSLSLSRSHQVEPNRWPPDGLSPPSSMAFVSLPDMVRTRAFYAVKNVCRRKLVQPWEWAHRSGGKTAVEWCDEYGEKRLAAELRYHCSSPVRHFVRNLLTLTSFMTFYSLHRQATLPLFFTIFIFHERIFLLHVLYSFICRVFSTCRPQTIACFALGLWI